MATRARPRNKKARADNPKVPYEGKFQIGATTSVGTIIEKMLESKNSAISIDEFSYEFIQQVGGAKGFVAYVIKDYENAIPGTPERARFMSIMMQLLTMVNDKMTQAKDIDTLSEEELQSYARSLMIDVGVPGVTSDGWCYEVCI